MIATLQCLQRGASAWIAHANESNVCDVPPIITSNALSYVFPQLSQAFIMSARLCKCRAAKVWNAGCCEEPT